MTSAISVTFGIRSRAYLLPTTIIPGPRAAELRLLRSALGRLARSPNQSRDGLAQLRHPLTAPRARHDQLLGVKLEGPSQRALPPLPLGSGQLIALRQRRQHAGLAGPQEARLGAGGRRGRGPDVGQPDDPAQPR